jgi:hypothetical protein
MYEWNIIYIHRFQYREGNTFNVANVRETCIAYGVVSNYLDHDSGVSLNIPSMQICYAKQADSTAQKDSQEWGEGRRMEQWRNSALWFANCCNVSNRKMTPGLAELCALYLDMWVFLISVVGVHIKLIKVSKRKYRIKHFGHPWIYKCVEFARSKKIFDAQSVKLFLCSIDSLI